MTELIEDLRTFEIEGGYKIREDGLVLNRFGNVINGSQNAGGYIVFKFWDDEKPRTRYLHRLIAEFFIPNPMGYHFVSHIDGNKKNNSIENLKWQPFSGKEIVKKAEAAIVKKPWRTIGEIAEDIDVRQCRIHKAFNKHSDLTADGFRRAEIERQIMEARS